MSAIITLTMNPAIDVSTSVDRVEPTRKLRCAAGRRDPGGGGINVARVATRLGADVTAIYPIGGYAGQLLKGLVDQDGIASIAVPGDGETREDFTVFDETTGEQYRFVLPGPQLYPAEWQACLKTLEGLVRNGDYVCASGGLPPGVPDDLYARVAAIATAKGARLALDASGPALKAGLTDGVYLIKPNLNELRELTGAALDDETAMVTACRGLIERGTVEVVALSLGAAGAILVTADEAWRASALPIHPVSSVGAGDSFLGAMMWALTSKLTLKESFRHAVAAGSASLLAEGTELCRPEDVRRLISEVRIEAIPAQPALEPHRSL
jgi:6-phosphofructokinase 2